MGEKRRREVVKSGRKGMNVGYHSLFLLTQKEENVQTGTWEHNLPTINSQLNNNSTSPKINDKIRQNHNSNPYHLTQLDDGICVFATRQSDDNGESNENKRLRRN